MLANHPTVIGGGGSATNVANGTFQLISPTGAINLTASGTNQNITLTPSGTGAVYFETPNTNPPALGLNGGTFRMLFTNFYGIIAGVTGTGNGWLQVQRTDTSATAYAFMLQPNGGNVLLGTTTDSSNGRLQLATHTTSAGGIGLGNMSLYRQDNDTLCLSTAGGATTIKFFRGVTGYGQLYFDTVDSFLCNFTNVPLRFLQNNTEKARFAATSGNFLLGTNTDSSNGILQLATHTTSAGGIAFGTDVSLYRSGVSGLSCNANFIAASLATSGGIASSNATTGIGYSSGAGGAVTQITSRTTGVTINNVSGAITLVSAIGSALYQTFTVTNSAVAATDVVVVSQKSGTDLYEVFVTNVSAGSFKITFATTGGTTTEQPVFNFAVIKAVAA